MKNALNLKHLKRALILSRHGSFVRASAELNISQSALSRSIMELESDLGATLFVRGRKGIRLTIAGTELLRAAESLLESAARIEASVRCSQFPSSPEVVFGIGAMPASVLLPHLLAQTLRAEQGPILDIRTSTTRDMLDQLTREEIGFFLAARQTIGRAPHIIAQPFVRLPLAVRVRQGHPLAGKKHVPWAEVMEYPIIGARFSAGGKVVPSDPPNPYSPVISVPDYTLLAATVRNSDAVCVFVSTMDGEGLVTLPTIPEGYDLDLDVSLVRLRGSNLSEAESQVLDTLREAASAKPDKAEPLA